ncbi:hypothetical protein SDC9_144211 [bioreactor metagenome]|uniref:Uncharacterized protein n=1 Tax=bioreactor metagenome TaxID=1076179 RepID=A0A645E5H1_9ZZZZ
MFIHYYLCDQRYYRNVAVPVPECISEALLDLVAYVALAHCAAYVKGHCRKLGIYLFRCFLGKCDIAHLGAVSVDNCHLIAFTAYVSKILAGLFYNCQLGLCCRRAPCFLQSVSAQSHNHFCEL